MLSRKLRAVKDNIRTGRELHDSTAAGKRGNAESGTVAESQGDRP
jgi:hypothetical protein